MDKIAEKNSVDDKVDKVDKLVCKLEEIAKPNNLKSEKDKKLNKKNSALSDALRKNLIRRKNVKSK
jgi:hypothetical protein